LGGKYCEVAAVRFNIRLAKALTTHTKKVYFLRLASPKLDVSDLSRDEEAVSRCEIALEQRDNETPEGALEIMRPLWRGVGTRPDTQGLQPETAADVFFCTGTLTGWIGSRQQIKNAQETARNLITESITYYEAHNLRREAAEARSELAYCYWREGQVNEARIMLHEALERLPPAGLKRARALLKLTDVEHSAARYYDALRLLTDNRAVFASVRNLNVKGSYHNELAITWRTIGSAEKQPDYFQRALTEYKAAEYQFKLAKNHIYRASVKNNEAVVLTKLARFKEAHKHLDQAREIVVRFKHRTLTAQFDGTRAELLITEGRFKDAEAVARRAAKQLEKAGHRCWFADALILQAIALARLEKQTRAHVTLQRAIEVAHEADALNKAGLATLTMIEEIDRLSPDTLQAAYQQAREWLADSQSREVLSRLSAAAGKLAASLRRELTRDEAVEILLTKPYDIDQKLLEYEHDLIKQALAQSDGKVTHAAKLVGKTYQGLAHMIKTKHPDLLKKRTPIRRRQPRNIRQSKHR
jgi:tetratricopeptide (TPR) repeat protein